MNWRDQGLAFATGDSPFARSLWAQQVVYRPDKAAFYMYYPGQPWGVGVATSPHPCGPYKDISPGGQPIMANVDDPTALVDPDTGIVYFCGNSGAGPNCSTMQDDMVTYVTPPVIVPLPYWFEAPWLTKLSGPNGTWYYLSYACKSGSGADAPAWSEHFGWDLCYGMSRAPFVSSSGAPGNFTFKGSLQWSPPHNCHTTGGCGDQSTTAGDNNHQGIFEFPAGSGTHYMAYHNRKTAQDRGTYLGFQRNVALDRLYVNWEDGSLVPVTATPHWLTPVRFVDPFMNRTAAEFAGASGGVATAPAPPGSGGAPNGTARVVTNVSDGAWIYVAGVDFGEDDATVAERLSQQRGVDGGDASLPLQGRRQGQGQGQQQLLREDVAAAPSPLAMVVSVASAAAGGRIDVVMRGVYSYPPGVPVNGSTIVASCTVPATGGLTTYAIVACVGTSAWSALAGQLDLYFVFHGANTSATMFNFGSWVILGGAVSGRKPTPVRPVVGLGTRGVAGRGVVLVSGSDGSGPLIAAPVGTSGGSFATYIVVDNEDGSYALKSAGNGAFVCASPQASGAQLFANATDPTLACARFTLYGTVDASYALESLATGGFVAAAGGVGAPLVANATDPRTCPGDAARFDLDLGVSHA